METFAHVLLAIIIIGLSYCLYQIGYPFKSEFTNIFFKIWDWANLLVNIEQLNRQRAIFLGADSSNRRSFAFVPREDTIVKNIKNKQICVINRIQKQGMINDAEVTYLNGSSAKVSCHDLKPCSLISLWLWKVQN